MRVANRVKRESLPSLSVIQGTSATFRLLHRHDKKFRASEISSRNAIAVAWFFMVQCEYGDRKRSRPLYVHRGTTVALIHASTLRPRLRAYAQS